PAPRRISQSDRSQYAGTEAFAIVGERYPGDTSARDGRVLLGFARQRPRAERQSFGRVHRVSRGGDYPKRAWSSFFAEFHQLADLGRRLRLAPHLLDVVERSPRS